MSTATITRQRRADGNGEPVIAYYRDATTHLVYRYADDERAALYDGATDKRIGTWDTVTELESALPGILS